MKNFKLGSGIISLHFRKIIKVGTWELGIKRPCERDRVDRKQVQMIILGGREEGLWKDTKESKTGWCGMRLLHYRKNISCPHRTALLELQSVGDMAWMGFPDLGMECYWPITVRPKFKNLLNLTAMLGILFQAFIYMWFGFILSKTQRGEGQCQDVDFINKEREIRRP